MNGTAVMLDAGPIIRNSRTLVPIKALIEALGGTVVWDGTARTVTVSLGEHVIVFTIGSNTALVDGERTTIDPADPEVVPEIINSRSFLPLRFVVESAGLELSWDASTQTISFTYQP